MTYRLAKSHRLPFDLVEHSIIAPLELIHFQIWQSFVSAHQSYKYFVFSLMTSLNLHGFIPWNENENYILYFGLSNLWLKIFQLQNRCFEVTVEKNLTTFIYMTSFLNIVFISDNLILTHNKKMWQNTSIDISYRWPVYFSLMLHIQHPSSWMRLIGLQAHGAVVTFQSQSHRD